MVGWKLLKNNNNKMGLTKRHLHVFHCTPFIHTLKSVVTL